MIAREPTKLKEQIVHVYTDKETRRILRKIDWHLLPVLAVLYLLAFLDRENTPSLLSIHTRVSDSQKGSNIGNAKVAGMNTDLGLTGQQYNLALTV